MRVAYSLNLSRNVLPSENYILYVDGKPVCIGGLRLKLNNYWKRHSGNIWYKTRPSERFKGYATLFVKMLVERAKCLGMTEVLAQCKATNIGSNKVLQKNGFKIYENPLYAKRKHKIETNFYKKTI